MAEVSVYVFKLLFNIVTLLFFNQKLVILFATLGFVLAGGNVDHGLDDGNLHLLGVALGFVGLDER